MALTILSVKLFVPPCPNRLIERLHLLRQFEDSLSHPFTLISAPAGFGKTTLLSHWFQRQCSRPDKATLEALCWLSLDPVDNDPARFWAYFISALQAGLNGLNRVIEPAAPDQNLSQALNPLVDLLQVDPPPPVQPVIDRLINEVSRARLRIRMVLDDYHVIHSTQLHEQMTYLLDHQPPELHVIISTRSDPPLPLSRLRVRGKLSEIRASDLRFSEVEIEQFITASAGIQLSAEDIERLEESTEGWAAGLQMAALALRAHVSEQVDPQQAQDKVRAFIASFSGKQTYVLDYLADEVFNQQPDAVQSFLLKTSILERLCAGLCDYVIRPGTEQASVWSGDEKPSLDSSNHILAYLEKSNLFLIPLDQERRWFRYHHLFADLLRARLEQTWPGLKSELHVHASEWYEQNGFMEDAINHAVTVQDWERAATLMENGIQSFLDRGQLSKVMDWVALLPLDVASQRAWLLVQQAHVFGLAHRMSEFVQLMAAEENAFEKLEQSGGATSEEIHRLRANLLFQKGYHAIAIHNPERAMALAHEGIQTLPPGCPWEESWLYWLRAYANRALNHLAQAEEGFQEAFHTSQQQKELWNDMVCLTDLAMVYQLCGRLKEARDLYLKVLDLGRQRRAAGHSYLNRVEGWLSLILLEQNDIEEAARHAETGLEWSQYWPSTNARSVTYIALGRVRLAKGDLPGAEEWLQSAVKERQRSPLMPVNNSLLDSNLVRIWLARGDLSTALRWAESLGASRLDLGEDPILDESLEVQLLAVARILITQGQRGSKPKLSEAIELLNRILRSARGSGRINSAVEGGVLKAVAMQLIAQAENRSGRADPAALSVLEECMAAGESGNYVRIFLEEGPLMAGLLHSLRFQYRPVRSPRYSTAYLDSLLAGFPPEEAVGERYPGIALPERLTERELEVLHLIAAGLSNKQMADRLVLSEGTIKSHIHHIMGKLEAQSRTDALAHAKELGLL